MIKLKSADSPYLDSDAAQQNADKKDEGIKRSYIGLHQTPSQIKLLSTVQQILTDLTYLRDYSANKRQQLDNTALQQLMPEQNGNSI